MKKHFILKTLLIITFTLLMARFIFLTEGLSWLYGGIRPLIYVGVILYVLSPFVDYLVSHTKLKRTGSVVIAFLTVFVAIGIFIGMVVPSMVESGRQIIVKIPQTNDQFLLLIEKIPFVSYFIDTSSLSSFLDATGAWITSISEQLLGYSDEILGSVVSFIGTVSIIVLSMLMAFYALKDNPHIVKSLVSVIHAYLPERITNPTFRILKLLDDAFRKFLVGKLYTCLALGVIVTAIILIFNMIGPWGLYIPYAPLIGFIIGITNIIPYIGPLIGTIPCLFLALLSGVWEVLVLLIVVLVAQQIDNILISPKILGDTVGLKPFWIVLSITVGGAMFGAIGMVLSIPITSVLLQLINERVESQKELTRPT